MKNGRTRWTREQAREFGARLRQHREAASLSQRDLSFPGCTAAYISRVEKGERYPSVVLIRGLAERLEVSADFLEFGEDRGMAEALIDRLNEATDGVLCVNFKREEGVEVFFGYDRATRSATGETMSEALLTAVRWAERIAALREEADETADELARLKSLATVSA